MGKVVLKDTLDCYISDLVNEYLEDENIDDNYFFKIAVLYELHRIADVFEDAHRREDHSLHITGTVTTYEQNF